MMKVMEKILLANNREQVDLLKQVIDDLGSNSQIDEIVFS
jgi:hypothetical protein